MSPAEAKLASDPVIHILLLISSSLSFIGATTIILGTQLTWFRSLQKHYLAIRLILWLSFCDFVVSGVYVFVAISSLSGHSDFFSSSSEIVCILQALIAEYFQLASFGWTISFAYALWSLHVTKRTWNDSQRKTVLKRLEWGAHLLSWIGPLPSVVILAALHQYGPAGPWCWIQSDDSEGDIFRFVFFYIPLWLSATFLTLVYLRVSCTVSKKNADNIPHRVSLYLLIFLFCYTPGTINRIQNWVSPEPWFWLECLQATTDPLQGFLNCLIYGWTTPILFQRMKAGGKKVGHMLHDNGLPWPEDDGSYTSVSEFGRSGGLSQTLSVEERERRRKEAQEKMEWQFGVYGFIPSYVDEEPGNQIQHRALHEATSIIDDEGVQIRPYLVAGNMSQNIFN
eukprot:TRINITY_DN10903_c0_g1_i1.p1 TRINITY_DN10903_c0_g1~~TRINITY_DN10903_c0_g1_i1.p1  ORF type:complete len:396 (-),score=31.02 TRINITY_DN10903_c0_g1_i1:140-1327(-)